MARFNKKDVIEALKLEMDIIAGGGYGRSLRTPWRANSLFRDSVSCLKVGETERRHPCTECFLIDHVPGRDKTQDIPCHHIPLNEKGETIDSLEKRGEREDPEQTLLDWIRATIKRLEQEPDEQQAPSPKQEK